jgi:DNA polymerase I-like protein with 3'-5' exonuclease and polymerase domains
MGGGKLCRNLDLPTVLKSFVSRRTGEKVEYLAPGPEGEKILKQFHERVPYIGMLAKEAYARAEKRGHVMTHSGRRCRFRKYNGEYIELHKALNRIIQGSAGDQMKMALCDLHRAGIPIQLTVHDEVDWSATCQEQMRQAGEIMRNAMTLRVPSKVDIEYGPDWGHLTTKLAA